MRASFLSSLFRHALLFAAAVPIGACGGQVSGSDDHDADTTDTLTNGDAPYDVPSGSCDTVNKPKESDPLPPCGYPLDIAGDPSLCGFDPTTKQAPAATCQRLCGHSSITFCTLFDNPGMKPYVECGGMCTGRKPSGLAPSHARGEAVGRWLAEVAYLEAASIDAFRTLRAELRAHRAPRALLRAASRAKRDEVRHARVTRSLARRYGGKSAKVTVTTPTARTLRDLALENAVEGCVKETFGALFASYQAEHATDPLVRAQMHRIARDETRHAALAWSIAKWARPRLDAKSRAEIDEAQRRAVDELRRDLQRVDPEVVHVVGAPDATRALALLDAVAHRLWSCDAKSA